MIRVGIAAWLIGFLLASPGCKHTDFAAGSGKSSNKAGSERDDQASHDERSPQTKESDPDLGDRHMDEIDDGSLSGEGERRSTQTFTIGATESTLLDMVWIIDNSKSMGDEVARVRANFKTFVQSARQLSYLKLALISAPFPEQVHGVTLSDYASGESYRQVPVKVESHDSLILATGATTGHFGGHIGNAAVLHSLKGFFREDARRVYVIVTDDNSTMTAGQFLQSQLPASPVVFAFAGIRKTCKIDKVGTVYMGLAQGTGGEVFDICQNDWSAHFQKLVHHVSRLVKSEFILQGSIEKIIKVELDGKPLDKSQYSFNQATRKLVLNATLLPQVQNGSKLVVTYQAA